MNDLFHNQSTPKLKLLQEFAAVCELESDYKAHAPDDPVLEEITRWKLTLAKALNSSVMDEFWS